MKPNPEQDADRAAFEKWLAEVIVPRNQPRGIAVEMSELAWQAAKADSRAMEDALEQVCASLLEHHKWQQEIGEVTMKYDNGKEVKVIDSNLSDDYADSGMCDRTCEALTLAAPFRKAGV